VREGGRDEEGKDERGERPERPVEVGRGRQVGGRERGRDGIERVDAAGEYLVENFSLFLPGSTQSCKCRGRKTDRFGVDVEVVLIVVYVPEGRVASVRDVACGRTFRGMPLVRKGRDRTSSLTLSRRRATDVACRGRRLVER
jgi:hypothetical protein